MPKYEFNSVSGLCQYPNCGGSAYPSGSANTGELPTGIIKGMLTGTGISTILHKSKLLGKVTMNIYSASTIGRLVAILTIVFGIIVIIVPEIIAYMIGAFLIVIGVLALIRK